MTKVNLAMLLMVIAIPSSGVDEADMRNAYSAFQKDADIVRLRDLRYYGELLEEYNDETGTYPFIHKYEVPLYIHVASPEQKEDSQITPPYEHHVKPFKDLIQTLEQGLGREIEEHYDPQYDSDGKPNFYIYMVFRDTYFFAVHLHQQYPFSKAISEGYNKVEISNNANVKNKAHSPSDLFSNKEFKEAV